MEGLGNHYQCFRRGRPRTQKLPLFRQLQKLIYATFISALFFFSTQSRGFRVWLESVPQYQANTFLRLGSPGSGLETRSSPHLLVGVCWHQMPNFIATTPLYKIKFNYPRSPGVVIIHMSVCKSLTTGFFYKTISLFFVTVKKRMWP